MIMPASGRIINDIQADIEAAIAAITVAISLHIDKLCIKTECEFLLAVEFWMSQWERTGWRDKTGKVVQNCKELQKLQKLLNNHAIAVTWVSLFGNVSNVYIKHIRLCYI